MAIWWVDPYRDAPVGGANGTTSTGQGNGAGTYTNPWSFAYVFKEACYSQWGDGDEVRFKGLPESTFFPETAGSGESGYTTGGGKYSLYESQIYSYTNPDDNTTTNIPFRYYIRNSDDSQNTSIFNNGRLIRLKQKDLTGTYGKTGKTFYYKTGQNTDNTLPTQANPYYYAPPLPTLDVDYGCYVMDPNYTIRYDINWNDNGQSGNGLYNLTANDVVFTSGWDSQTTQNGITIIDFASSSLIYNGNNGLRIGNYGWTNYPGHRHVNWDCDKMIWAMPDNVYFYFNVRNLKLKSLTV